MPVENDEQMLETAVHAEYTQKKQRRMVTTVYTDTAAQALVQQVGSDDDSDERNCSTIVDDHGPESDAKQKHEVSKLSFFDAEYQYFMILIATVLFCAYIAALLFYSKMSLRFK